MVGGNRDGARPLRAHIHLTRKACDAVLKQGKSMIGMGK
jgi:hypothetical protein